MGGAVYVVLAEAGIARVVLQSVHAVCVCMPTCEACWSGGVACIPLMFKNH